MDWKHNSHLTSMVAIQYLTSPPLETNHMNEQFHKTVSTLLWIVKLFDTSWIVKFGSMAWGRHFALDQVQTLTIILGSF